MKPRTALIAALMIGLATFGVTGSPAQAATVIHANYSVEFNPPPGPGVINLRTLVHVETNLYDGVGYMNNGARIELRYYGADPGTDQLILGPYRFYKGAPGLTVNDQGIWLDNLRQVAAYIVNEDNSIGNQGDELYVNVRFIDGDGHMIQTDSNEVDIFI